MDEKFIRSQMLLGKEAIEKLKNSKVAVFGLGGVGSYTAAALARCGIGHFLLVDGDIVAPSNINRQLIATLKTLGRYKADVMKEYILDINENADIETLKIFYKAENFNEVDLSKYDYVADAIDMVSSKLLLIEKAALVSTPVISSMGAGNKLDAGRFEVADIYETSVCPLARVMRKELRARNIEKLKVVYSKEEAIKPEAFEEQSEKKRQTPGSISFVPPVVGLIMAGEIVKDLV